MTNLKLEQLNSLAKQITELERIISNCKTQKCEWIEFTFGNGSNKANVCNSSDIIESVRTILVRENEQVLAKLKIEFETL